MHSRQTHSLSYFQYNDCDAIIVVNRDNPDVGNVDRQPNVIQAAIQAKVGWDMPNVPAMKNLKNVPTPDKFGGSDDAKALMA